MSGYDCGTLQVYISFVMHVEAFVTQPDWQGLAGLPVIGEVFRVVVWSTSLVEGCTLACIVMTFLGVGRGTVWWKHVTVWHCALTVVLGMRYLCICG